ncbi:hypothetical protein [Glutamicibacter sp. NPDC087344]|uniref:hypothetical protein n=1 Tax=Glutamicibacter sp. NPDC087344 TaxID=3363994 RepID=UPI00380307B5
MKKPYVKFTAFGLILGSLITFMPWMLAEPPASLACQSLGIFTVFFSGLFFAYTAHIASPSKQAAKDKKIELVEVA